MKTYHSYQAELRQAEVKLQSAENQRSKLEQSLSQDKLDRSKKYKMMEKEVQKVFLAITMDLNYDSYCNFYFRDEINTGIPNWKH